MSVVGTHGEMEQLKQELDADTSEEDLLGSAQACCVGGLISKLTNCDDDDGD